MTGSGVDQPRLPPAVAALVDGTGLAGKTGTTILLTAVDSHGWPRQALLSAGEVLSLTGSDVRLALYAGSRTTRALDRAGQALLTVVLPPAVHKIWVRVARVPMAEGPLAGFAGRVAALDEDRVGYARIASGITFALPDPEPVIRRWQRQLDQLRALAP